MLPHCPYWQVRGRKLEMQGTVGKHAPANANKGVKILSCELPPMICWFELIYVRIAWYYFGEYSLVEICV